jgi:hypothetical protein
MYGYNGNSFVCVVEFGPKIKKSLLVGGNSSDPKSKHFNDQVEMYRKGEFKDVLFYKEAVEKCGTQLPSRENKVVLTCFKLKLYKVLNVFIKI